MVAASHTRTGATISPPAIASVWPRESRRPTRVATVTAEPPGPQSSVHRLLHPRLARLHRLGGRGAVDHHLLQRLRQDVLGRDGGDAGEGVPAGEAEQRAV